MILVPIYAFGKTKTSLIKNLTEFKYNCKRCHSIFKEYFRQWVLFLLFAFYGIFKIACSKYIPFHTKVWGRLCNFFSKNTTQFCFGAKLEEYLFQDKSQEISRCMHIFLPGTLAFILKYCNDNKIKSWVVCSFLYSLIGYLCFSL